MSPALLTPAMQSGLKPRGRPQRLLHWQRKAGGDLAAQEASLALPDPTASAGPTAFLPHFVLVSESRSCFPSSDDTHLLTPSR